MSSGWLLDRGFMVVRVCSEPLCGFGLFLVILPLCIPQYCMHLTHMKVAIVYTLVGGLLSLQCLLYDSVSQPCFMNTEIWGDVHANQLYYPDLLIYLFLCVPSPFPFFLLGPLKAKTRFIGGTILYLGLYFLKQFPSLLPFNPSISISAVSLHCLCLSYEVCL